MRAFGYVIAGISRSRWLYALAAIMVLSQAFPILYAPSANVASLSILADPIWGLPVQTPGDRGFRWPVTWITYQAMLSLIIAVNARKPFSGIDTTISVKLGSRLAIYSSRCIWVLSATIIFYILLGTIELSVHMLAGSLPVLLDQMSEAPGAYIAYLVVLPISASVAVGMCQITLTIIVNEYVGFIASVIYFGLTTASASSLLLGNLAMATRSPIGNWPSYNTVQTIIFTVVWTLVWLAIGFLATKRSEAL